MHRLQNALLGALALLAGGCRDDVPRESGPPESDLQLVVYEGEMFRRSGDTVLFSVMSQGHAEWQAHRTLVLEVWTDAAWDHRYELFRLTLELVDLRGLTPGTVFALNGRPEQDAGPDSFGTLHVRSGSTPDQRLATVHDVSDVQLTVVDLPSSGLLRLAWTGRVDRAPAGGNALLDMPF